MRSSWIYGLTAFLYWWGILLYFLNIFFCCFCFFGAIFGLHVESGHFGLLSNRDKHSWDLLLTPSPSHSLGFKIAQVGIKKIQQILIFLLDLYKSQMTCLLSVYLGSRGLLYQYSRIQLVMLHSLGCFTLQPDNQFQSRPDSDCVS